MIHYTNCPVCKADTISFKINIKDHSITRETFPVWSCASCSLLFTQDVPDENEIGKYYTSTDYISHSDTKEGIINSIYHRVRNITLKSKRKLVVKLVGKTKGDVLDIGSGTGAYLYEMKMNGWGVTGIEADRDAGNMSHSKYHISTQKPEELFTLPGKYDVITMWHVLEHVHKLEDYLKRIHQLLVKDGVFIVAVPNYTSADAKAYGSMWAAYDVPRHLYHFSPQSMKVLMEKYGFEIVESKPMWFDSFYVSLLSEKYRKGSINYFRAFVKGLLSNFVAMRDNNRCSSVIYIMRLS